MEMMVMMMTAMQSKIRVSRLWAHISVSGAGLELVLAPRLASWSTRLKKAGPPV